MILLSERLRILRNERGMVQQDVADLLKIRVRTYQCYERDEHRPDLETLVTLADFYQVTLDYLVGRSDERG